MECWINKYREKWGIQTYEEILKKQYSYLDQIDFIPYIKEHEDLDDVWDAIELAYDNTPLSSDEFLQGNIFNEMDHYDLQKYILDKYNIDYRETAIITYIRQPLPEETKAKEK